jgi:thymidylate kinase
MMRKSAERHRPFRVSFSGIDGAGKSTQIEILYAALSASGIRVRLVTFWEDVAILPRLRETATHVLFKGEKGVGSPERPVNRRDKNVRSWYMTGARMLLYFFEAISLRCATTRARDADIIIFDRYLYDQIANLPIKYASMRTYARFLLRLVHQPDIAYLLDADPVVARQRKPEYPLEFLGDSRASYLELCRIGNMTLVAPGSVSQVANAIMQRFACKFPICGMEEDSMAHPGLATPPHTSSTSFL